ncbi:MAG: hypothetical protein HEQ35_15145 [Gloeotrichia echinulata IR180]|jgi:hypothetical protein|nr:hypothetical protein [Gloeotrichia echinulata DEX184]
MNRIRAASRSEGHIRRSQILSSGRRYQRVGHEAILRRFCPKTSTQPTIFQNLRSIGTRRKEDLESNLQNLVFVGWIAERNPRLYGVCWISHFLSGNA